MGQCGEESEARTFRRTSRLADPVYGNVDLYSAPDHADCYAVALPPRAKAYPRNLQALHRADVEGLVFPVYFTAHAACYSKEDSASAINWAVPYYPFSIRSSKGRSPQPLTDEEACLMAGRISRIISSAKNQGIQFQRLGRQNIISTVGDWKIVSFQLGRPKVPEGQQFKSASQMLSGLASISCILQYDFQTWPVSQVDLQDRLAKVRGRFPRAGQLISSCIYSSRVREQISSKAMLLPVLASNTALCSANTSVTTQCDESYVSRTEIMVLNSSSISKLSPLKLQTVEISRFNQISASNPSPEDTMQDYFLTRSEVSKPSAQLMKQPCRRSESDGRVPQANHMVRVADSREFDIKPTMSRASDRVYDRAIDRPAESKMADCRKEDLKESMLRRGGQIQKCQTAPFVQIRDKEHTPNELSRETAREPKQQASQESARKSQKQARVQSNKKQERKTSRGMASSLVVGEGGKRIDERFHNSLLPSPLMEEGSKQSQNTSSQNSVELDEEKFQEQRRQLLLREREYSQHRSYQEGGGEDHSAEVRLSQISQSSGRSGRTSGSKRGLYSFLRRTQLITL